MSGMEDFAYAQAIEKAVRAFARDEISKLRPAPRYGTVKEINAEEKSCMVLFTGEDIPVRVVYNNVVPALVGQHVRVEGIPGDRYITAVRGSTDADYQFETVNENIATVDGKADVADGKAVAAQRDVNVARSNLAGTQTTDAEIVVGDDEIFDNAGFIGYSKCYFIANTLADWSASSGDYEFNFLGITAYNGVSVNQLSGTGRYSVTILEDGYYEFHLSGTFGMTGGSSRRIFVKKNDGTELIVSSASPNGNASSAVISGATIYIEAGTVIRFWLSHDSGSGNMWANGTWVQLKKISSADPAKAIGTLASNMTISFTTARLVPMRNNSGGTWTNGEVSSPVSIALGSVTGKVKFSGGSGSIRLIRNGVTVRTVSSALPFSGTYTFIWSGPIAPTDKFWFEADATGTYYGNDTYIRISGV